MARYAARRLLLLVPGILSAAIVTFALLLLLPGDPALALLRQAASEVVPPAAGGRGTPVDTGTMLLAQLGVSMPVFWLGVLLILLFAVKLNWLPSFGRGGPLPSALGTGETGAGPQSPRAP